MNKLDYDIFFSSWLNMKSRNVGLGEVLVSNFGFKSHFRTVLEHGVNSIVLYCFIDILQKKILISRVGASVTNEEKRFNSIAMF